MIQTADQYVCLYQTLIEGILTMDTNMSLQEYLTTKRLRMDTKSQYKVRRRSPYEIKAYCNIVLISFSNNCNQRLNTHIEVLLIRRI